MKPVYYLTPVLLSAAVLLSGCQSGTKCCARPQATAAPASSVSGNVAASQPERPVIRINAGIGAVKDATGTTWLEDTGFVGGDVIDRPDLPIANTKHPEIYRSERYAMEAFRYQLPNGKYEVKLHFCETFEGIFGPGDRVFSFAVEGKPFKDFDVWVKSGGGARAYVETVPVEITDGQLDITFTMQIENPQINGIEIIPVN